AAMSSDSGDNSQEHREAKCDDHIPDVSNVCHVAHSFDFPEPTDLAVCVPLLRLLCYGCHSYAPSYVCVCVTLFSGYFKLKRGAHTPCVCHTHIYPAFSR